MEKKLTENTSKTKHFKRSVITHLLKTVLSFPKGLYKVKIENKGQINVFR